MTTGKEIENLSEHSGSKTAATASTQSVVVTDVQIPFVSMVVLLVKWAIAAIPAAIILMLIGVLLPMFCRR